MEHPLSFTRMSKRDENIAIMFLTKPIGVNHQNPDAPFIDGALFAEEMYRLKAQGKKIQVRINSVGGNVVQGWSILDAVESTGAETHIIGIAASMAGVIYLAGSTRSSEPYGTLMLHGPHGGSDRYRGIVSAQFKELLSVRTKLSDEKITAILNDGDHYFDSSDMQNFGLVDNIPSHRSVKFTRPAKATAEELFEIYNSLNENETINLKNQLMDIFSTLFGGKNEQETAAKAMEVRNENDRLKTELAAKQAEVEAKKKEVADLTAKLESFEKVAVSAKATALVEEAITSGKLTLSDENKVKMIEKATADFESVKMMIESIPAPTKQKKFSVSAHLTDEEKKKVTYAYLAENEPEKLNAIMENDKPLYDRLVKEYHESIKSN